LRPTTFKQRRAFVRSGSDVQDSLSVIEVGLSPSLVQRLGQLNLFAVARYSTPETSGTAVSVVPLVDWSGVTMGLEAPGLDYTTLGGGNGPSTGITYRPLVGSGGIPSSWSAGQMCFQRTAAVGVDGASIIHEIESADCEPLDTYCNPGECAAGRGQSIQLPDAPTLAGG
jgi:hypothetical protein